MTQGELFDEEGMDLLRFGTTGLDSMDKFFMATIARYAPALHDAFFSLSPIHRLLMEGYEGRESVFIDVNRKTSHKAWFRKRGGGWAYTKFPSQSTPTQPASF